MSIEKILNRLEMVKRVGENRWIARCCAHDDKTPSLTITRRHDKILVHCFAGCDPVDVLYAIGLKWDDLFAIPRGNREAVEREHFAEKLIVEQYLSAKRQGKKICPDDENRVSLAVHRLRGVA